MLEGPTDMFAYCDTALLKVTSHLLCDHLQTKPGTATAHIYIQKCLLYIRKN